MKKILGILIMIIWGSIGFSQSYVNWIPSLYEEGQFYNLIHKGFKLDSLYGFSNKYDTEDLFHSSKLIITDLNTNDSPVRATHSVRYDSLGDWNQREEIIYTYDENHHLIEYEQVNHMKYSFNYNENGQIINEIHFIWNEEVWDTSYYEEKNILHQTTLEWWKNWNSNIQKFTSGYKNIFKYENENITDTHLELDTNLNVWINSTKDIYVYENGKKLNWYWYFWNESFKTWDENSRTEYIYTNDQLAEEIHYSWFISDWNKYYRFLNFYDNSYIVKTEYQRWNGTNWVSPFYTTIYLYDEDYNLVNKSWYKIENNISKIEQSYKYEYEDEKLTFFEKKNFNSETDSVTNGEKYIYDYTQDHKVIKTSSSWNKENYQWINFQRYSMELYESFLPKTSLLENWDKTQNNWKQIYKSILYWSEFTGELPLILSDSQTIIEKPFEFDISYSNPYKIGAPIYWKSESLLNNIDVYLYNLNGQLCHKKRIYKGESFFIDNVNSGLYILHIENNGESLKNKKIIISE